MKYVMSDIHGCYDKFIKMLELIELKTEDELYILGDIFDRGDKPLEILDYIINHKNIVLLKGNHEKMYEEYYETNDVGLWYGNGGQKTHCAIMNMETYNYDEILYKYIRKLPLYKVVDKFILVHAGLYLPSNYENLSIEELMELQEEDIMLWDRSNVGCERKINDYTIIVGHTPMQLIDKNYEEVKILYRNGTIYIDCGCVFKKANGKLSCLRLNDMQEFYI